jgi:hypothetical protein
MFRHQHFFTAAAVSLAIAGSFGATRAPESRAVKVSGSAELTYSQQHALDVPDAAGHQLLAGETKGTNKNTGGGDFMSNVPVINVETADLTQGTGTHEGYYTMGKGADTLVAKWHGRVKTTMAGNQPNTTFDGTWEYVHGAGQYASAKGKGTYKGQFLAKDRYAVMWEGNYTR